MADITIPLSGPPSERPAVPAKTFADLFITDLSIRAHDPDLVQDSIYIEYVPYDKASGGRLLSDKRQITLPLWETVQEIPEAGQAFGAIALAIPALVAYQAAKSEAAANPVP